MTDILSFKLVGDVSQWQRATAVGMQASDRLIGKLESVRNTALGIGVGFAAGGFAIKRALTATLGTFGRFEAGMARVQAVSSLTETQIQSLEKASVDLAKTTQFTATDVTRAYKFMAQAGLGFAEISSSIAPTVKLAAAGSLDLARAADITTSVMAAYGQNAEEVQSTTDVMAKAFTSAKIDVEGIGEAFKFVGATGKTFGVDLEDLIAAIGSLGQAGIPASQAGRSLSILFTRLSVQSEKLKKLGVNIKDASGQLRPLVEIVQQFEKVPNDAIIKLLPANAFRALAALREQLPELRNLRTLLNDAGGTAQRLADAQMLTLEGRVNSMKASFEGLWITIGRTIAPLTKRLADAFGEIATKVTNLISKWPKLTAGIIAVSAAIIGTGGLVTSLALVSSGALLAFNALFGLSKIKAVFTGLATASKAFLIPLLKIVAIAGSITTIIGGISIFQELGELRKQAEQGNKIAIARLAEIQKQTGGTFTGILKTSAGRGFDLAFGNIADSFVSSLDKAMDKVASLLEDDTKVPGAAKKLGANVGDSLQQQMLESLQQTLAELENKTGGQRKVRRLGGLTLSPLTTGAAGAAQREVALDIARDQFEALNVSLATATSEYEAEGVRLKKRTQTDAALVSVGQKLARSMGDLGPAASELISALMNSGGSVEKAGAELAFTVIRNSEAFSELIESVDGLLVAFSKVIDLLQPATGVISKAVDFVSSGIESSMNAIKGLIGINVETEVIQIVKRQFESLGTTMDRAIDRLVGLAAGRTLGTRLTAPGQDKTRDITGVEFGTTLGLLNQRQLESLTDAIQAEIDALEDQLVLAVSGVDTDKSAQTIQNEIERLSTSLETASEQLEKTVDEMGRELRNVPEGFKINLRKFQAITGETTAPVSSAISTTAAIPPALAAAVEETVENMAVVNRTNSGMSFGTLPGRAPPTINPAPIAPVVSSMPANLPVSNPVINQSNSGMSFGQRPGAPPPNAGGVINAGIVNIMADRPTEIAEAIRSSEKWRNTIRNGPLSLTGIKP